MAYPSIDIGANPLPIMEVFVSDREVEPNIAPLYQGLPLGALSTSQTFFLRCQEASL